jgi:hypothetical protein
MLQQLSASPALITFVVRSPQGPSSCVRSASGAVGPMKRNERATLTEDATGYQREENAIRFAAGIDVDLNVVATACCCMSASLTIHQRVCCKRNWCKPVNI